MPVALHAWLPALAALAQEAGAAIFAHYHKQRAWLAEKSDGSPLTAADLAAHGIIEDGLRQHYPGIPVISEESADKRLAAGHARFWLVDPLDGTREFLNGNGEFTVNIALIEDGCPSLGVVYAPALGRTYLGQRGTGAWRTTARITERNPSPWTQDIECIGVARDSGIVRVVASRSHADPRTFGLLASVPRHELVHAGSSLKFCMVAEGSADFYPRLGATMEWDTAAAQCVLEAAGGKVVKLDGRAPTARRIGATRISWRSAPGCRSTMHLSTSNQRGSEAMNSISPNILWHHATVTRRRREEQNRHASCVLWFTGLSGSGKSTLAHAVEEALHRRGCRTFVLDGDNVRHGLCGDLAFSESDRKENIRRVGEAAKLFVEAGVITLTAFISPFRADRERVRRLIGDADFIEIYCHCPLAVCEERDVKGLYRKARQGLIKDFTGVSSPYEEPEYPAFSINTAETTVAESVNQVMDFLAHHGKVQPAQEEFYEPAQAML